jgi:hypothetical protein
MKKSFAVPPPYEVVKVTPHTILRQMVDAAIAGLAQATGQHMTKEILKTVSLPDFRGFVIIGQHKAIRGQSIIGTCRQTLTRPPP